MKQVQPVLRLAVVLLLAASRGQAKKAAGLEAEAPLQPPRYDFSRYFGAHGGGGGDPGGGFGGGLGADKPAAAASERDTSAGFVEPVDFKSFFSADSGGGGGFGGQRAASPFFGASSLSASKQQSRLPFGSNPFGALAAASSAETDDFGDFSKAKRGAGGEAGQEQQRDDDFFHFDFADGGGTKADLHDEDGEDRDEADDEDGDSAGHSRPLKAANARYPSYSSYYHTQPEQLRAGGSGSGGSANANAEADDDDFGFDDEEGGGGGGAAADIRTPSRNPLGASAEAYDSRPFRDASQHTADASAPLKGPGPARFSLQGGFVPSPVDPLRTQASQEQAAKAAQSSKAASHAAVHAAVRAAHQAAASHGKTAAAAGTGLGLGANPLLGAAAVAGLGPVMRTFVRRTREEPDDAFFEAYNDGDEKEGDDYRFGPEHFGDEDEDDESPRGKQAAEAEDDGEAQQSAAATPGSCKKVKKKGSVCMVCADPKTGGNYEQCQYATEPETQSYSFGRSSSYGNPRGKTRRRRRREEGRHQQEAQDSSLEASLDSSQDTSQDTASKGSQRQQDAAGETGDVAEAQDGPAAGVGVGLDSHEEDHAKIQEELDRSLEQLQGPKYEDYFSFLFPELAKEKEGEQVKEKKSDKKGKKKEKKEKKSKKAKKGKKKAEEDDSEEVSSLLSRLEDEDEDPFAAGTSAVGAGTGPAADLWLGPPESAGAGAPGSGVGVVPKKDLERMLGEFQQKDRSDCTKVEKDKMTCYQCVDKKGMQHEECMFVAASEPKQSHVAYHQSSAFKQPGPPPKADGATAATATATTTAGPPRTATARAAASSNAPSAVAAPAKGAQGAQGAKGAKGAKGGAKSRQQRAAEPEKAEAEAEAEADEDDEKEELHDEDEEVVEPEGLGQGPDDGMFTEETKPVYDRALKMSLPKYMLDRSENERVFDEVLASGV